MPPIGLLGGTTPANLVTWLAGQSCSGNPAAVAAGGLGPLGRMTLDQMCELARDRVGGAVSVKIGPGLGDITLDELRAIAEDTRTLEQILRP